MRGISDTPSATPSTPGRERRPRSAQTSVSRRTSYAPTAGNPLAGLAKVDATGSATWASAASGSVGFNNDFALSVVQPSILFFLPVGYDFNSFWQYSFTPATDATFTMSYDVSAGGLVSADFGGWFLRCLMAHSSTRSRRGLLSSRTAPEFIASVYWRARPIRHPSLHRA